MLDTATYSRTWVESFYRSWKYSSLLLRRLIIIYSSWHLKVPTAFTHLNSYLLSGVTNITTCANWSLWGLMP